MEVILQAFLIYLRSHAKLRTKLLAKTLSIFDILRETAIRIVIRKFLCVLQFFTNISLNLTDG